MTLVAEKQTAPTTARIVTSSVAMPIRSGRRARRIRVHVVHACLVVVLVCVASYSISVGDFPIPVADVIPAIFGHGSDDADFIVRTLRLPRILTGVLVGVSFGVSGAIFQSLARNPLASPDIIGITSGATASAVFVIVVLSGSSALVSGAALVGALVTALAIYLLAWRNGVSPYRLVLIGIGISAVLSSATSYLITRAEIYDAQRAMVWLTGSLNARGWDHVRPVAISLLVVLPVVVGLSRGLNALQMGDDMAKGLGVSVERSRLGLIVAAVMLAAIATSAAGPIAFVAFMSPPLARRLTRIPSSLIASGLVGAVLVVAADLVARRLFAPTELPVGVVTGVVGGPFLLWLLIRVNRVGG